MESACVISGQSEVFNRQETCISSRLLVSNKCVHMYLLMLDDAEFSNLQPDQSYRGARRRSFGCQPMNIHEGEETTTSRGNDITMYALTSSLDSIRTDFGRTKDTSRNSQRLKTYTQHHENTKSLSTGDPENSGLSRMQLWDVSPAPCSRGSTYFRK